MRKLPFLTATLLLTVGTSLQAGSRWPQFRGPDATGVSEDKNLTDRWSPNENVAWSVPIPGRAWASPIVWDEKVFVTTASPKEGGSEPRRGLYPGSSHKVEETHRWIVLCLDSSTGNILWQEVAHEGVPQNKVHIKNTYASETPITDGEGVYAYFGNVGLFAYDMEGTKLWEKRWEKQETRYGWGTASSPVLDGDRIYIVNDNEKHSYLVAVDRKTGKEVWKVDRDEKSNWSTPFVWKTEGRTEIVTPGTGKVRSYDLEGNLLWHLESMSSITIATPYASHGLLYVTSGFILDRKMRPIYAIRPGARGDIGLREGQTSNEHIAWRQPKAAPYNPSTIVYGDHLYVLYDQGFLACHDARSGKDIYSRQRIARRTSGFTSSPWAYGGKVFCLSEDGDTFVIQAGPEFKVLHKNSLGEMCMATPAIAGGSLFIRTISKLYCVRQSGKKDTAGS